MRIRLAAVIVLALLATTAFAQINADLTEKGSPDFRTEFPSSGDLRLHLRSCDLKIMPSDKNELRVHYRGKPSADLSNVKLTFQAKDNTGELKIDGGPRSDFSIEIYVPATTSLYLRMFAGDVDINGVHGSKDIEIHAGDLNVGIGDPNDYGSVDASVHAGDLNLSPFGVAKGGLFRSFNQQGKGPYKLHVHTGAGDINITR